MINVTISGAVQSPGPQSLSTPALLDVVAACLSHWRPDAPGRFSAAPLDPERVVWTFLILGSALFCIALWKKFFSMQ
jgi:hypothetical protein